jgi:uncharacterized caspase-like protein
MKFKTLNILLPAFVFLLFSNVVFPQTSREPFIFELPETSTAQYTKPIIRLPAKSVPSIRFRVLEPFERDINYGEIIITLNGEGVNRGCDKTRDAQGKVITCYSLKERISGFEMQTGKNVVEIKATDRAKREFYASYVVILGDKNAPLETNDWTNGKAEKFAGKKYAVVVGVSEYQFTDAGLKSLQYADDDAQAVADFLKTPAGGSFSSTDIKLLLNKDATLGSLRGALSDIGKRARQNDLVFIFIAGHGAPDPLASQNLYFLLHDSKVVDMSRTAYPMNELKMFLDTNVKAERVITMIDTCHSAGVNQKTKEIISGRDLVQDGDENNISTFYLTNQLFKETGRAILTSSDVNEVSQEASKWGNHGVFTWALLDGLNGKADLNKDSFITTGEIFQFTRAAVQKETAFKQNPRALPGANTNLTLAFAVK